MSIRDVLAENFKKLREATPTLSTPSQFKARGLLSNGTLGRIANSEVNLGIDSLEPLAEAYRIEPWQLLNPAFSPANSGEAAEKSNTQSYRHIVRSIALLVDPIPDSDLATQRKILLAVSQICQEWSERQSPTTPLDADQKKPIESHRAKT